MTNYNNNNKLIPFSTIEHATTGDIEAINDVLAHFSGYIATLSARQLYDQYGASYMCIDEEMKRRLHSKLISKILLFNLI